MARNHYLIFGILALLLTACGQVGTITGGDKDVTAPRIIVEEVQPPMESTNVAPQKIIIPFDEFIEFNKPSENIRVTPADVQLDHEIKRKSVVMTVKSGEWKPNTTYTVYLNRAVKDITEANDSIIAYVFSTGDFLDSLKTAVQVNDAYSGKPVNGVTVGLYTSKLVDDTSKIEPRYYASTNKEGIARFQFIKDTTFYIYAFEDENLNNRLDASEKRAILRTPAPLDTVFDTGPIIRLMPPTSDELSIVSNEVLPTATWALGFNRTLKEEEEFVFLPPEPLQVIWNKERDSLSAFYGMTKASGSLVGILKTATQSDTITKRFFFKDKKELQLKITNNLSQNKLLANDTLKIKANEPFKSIDTSAITLEVIEVKDSVRKTVPYSITTTAPHKKELYFNKKNIEKAFLSIPPHAIEGQNYSLSDSLNWEFTFQKPKETGIMIVEFDTIPAYGVLVITQKANQYKKRVVFDGIEKSSHRIEFLQPGEYSFHYLYDKDKNGQWTTGSIFEEKEAETILWFKATSTIRANWEVKTTLPIKILKEEKEEGSAEEEE